MGSAFSVTFSNMVMLILLIGLGFFLKKSKLVPEHLDTVISKLSVYIFLPSLFLYSFTSRCTPENFSRYSSMLLFGTLFYVGSALLSVMLVRFIPCRSEYMRAVYCYALVIPNTGAFGMPLVTALYGADGLFIYNMFLIPANIIGYAWAVPMLIPSKDGKGGFQPKKLLNPCMMACLIGMVLGLFHAGDHLPATLMNTVQNLGSCYSQLSLVTVGYVIASYDLSQIIQPKADLFFSALRLLVYPGIFLLLLKLFHAPAMVTALVILTFASPIGMNTVIFPAAYGEDSKIGAGLVMVSSLLAVLTLPLMYSLAV